MPTCQQQDFAIGSQKLSKAVILQKSECVQEAAGHDPTLRHLNVVIVCDGASGTDLREVRGAPCAAYSVFLCSAIDYIQFLHKEKKKQEEEVSTLRKDVMALKIMKV